ncbi:MAG: hypothetical protein ACR652_15370, partial [Methylocystis sp.]|uniref:hypothetical protein n=1 Tax=Methylocystis sp. TaxID=1911079 RepID=UPI003DA66B93
TTTVAAEIAGGTTAMDMVVAAVIGGAIPTTVCHVEKCSAKVTELPAAVIVGDMTTAAMGMIMAAMVAETGKIKR